MARQKNIRNTGFSNTIIDSESRLIQKDGHFNIRKTGRTFFERFSVFHWLIHLRFVPFLAILFSTYLILNTLFALAYVFLGINGLSGYNGTGFIESFLYAFYFSAQTMTTVGYGAISPVENAHSFVAAAESFIGLLGFAISTGLLYGRFSRPRNSILFSENALVSPYLEDQKGLMVRLANFKDNQLIDVHANMIIAWVEADDPGKRRFFSLALEFEKISMLQGSWTLVHPIDKESPITEFKAEDFKNRKGEIIIQMRGYDETYAQEIHARTSYTFDEVVWGAKFIPIFSYNMENQSTIALDKLSDFNRVEM